MELRRLLFELRIKQVDVLRKIHARGHPFDQGVLSSYVSGAKPIGAAAAQKIKVALRDLGVSSAMIKKISEFPSERPVAKRNRARRKSAKSPTKDAGPHQDFVGT